MSSIERTSHLFRGPKHRRRSTGKRKGNRRRMSAELLEDRRVLAAIAWDGGGDGENWSDPLNWESDALPSLADDVLIDVPDANAEIVIDAPTDATVNSLLSREPMALRGKLTVANASEFEGGLRGYAGEIVGNSDITLSGDSFFVQGANATGTGTLVVAAGTNLTLQRATIGLPLDIRGSLLAREFATLEQDLVNQSGGIVRTEDDVTLTIQPGATFENLGTFAKTDTGISELVGHLINQGEIDVQSGTLDLNGHVDNQANIFLPSTGTLNFQGSLDAGVGIVIDGDGRYEFNGVGPFDFSDSQFLPTGLVDFFGFTSQVIINNTLPAEATFGNIRTSIEFGADQVLSGPAGFQAGTISGAGNLVLDGEWTISGSTFEGSGDLTIPAGSRLRAFGSFNTIDRDTEVFGELVRVIGALSVQRDLEIHPAGTFEVAGGNPNFPNPAIRTEPTTTIRSFGTLKKTGAGEATISPFGNIETNGPLIVAAGKLEINVPTQIHGLVDVIGELRLNGETQTSSGTSISGSGILTLGSGPVAINDASIDVGILELRGAATIGTTIPTTTQVNASNAQVLLNADQHFVSPSLSVSTLRGPASLDFSGAVGSNDSRIEVEGDVTIAAGATWNAFGNLSLPDATNHGNLRLRGSSLALNGTLTNANDGSVNLETAIEVGRFSSGTLANDGLVRKISAAEVRFLDELVNRGIVQVEQGKLDFRAGLATSGGDYRVDADAELRAPSGLFLDANSQLAGNGLVNGNVASGGLVAPGIDPGDIGTLTIQGTYTQTADGTFKVDANSATAGSFDVLAISGAVNMAGDLVVGFSAGNQPAVGESFAPLTFASVAGDVDAVRVEGNVNGRGAETRLEANALFVDVIAENAAERLRVNFNQAASVVRTTQVDATDQFSQPSDQVPLVADADQTVASTWQIADPLSSSGELTLPNLATPVQTIEELRDQLENAGLTVLCAGDCTDGSDLQVLYEPDAIESSVTLDAADFSDTALADFLSQSAFTTEANFTASIRPRFGINVSSDGFSFAKTSSLEADFNVHVVAAGQLEPFRAQLDGQFGFSGGLSFDALDIDENESISTDELVNGLSALVAKYTIHPSSVSIDLQIEELDYVDALPGQENSPRGGDAFTIRAESVLSTSADPSPTIFSNVVSEWSSPRLLNPDIDQDGEEDFTTEVLVENARSLAQDVIRGNRTQLIDQLGLGLDDASLVATGDSFGAATDLASSVAEYLIGNTEVLDIIDFDTIETWLGSGVPNELDELIRFTTELEDLPLDLAATVTVDPTELLPGVTLEGAVAGIRNGQISGQLVFGLDTSDDPFYLLIDGDAVSDQATALALSVEMFAAADRVTVGEDLIELGNASGFVRPEAVIGFTAGGNAKLRLSELGSVTVGLSAGVESASATSLYSDTLNFFPGRPSTDFSATSEFVTGSIDLSTGATQLEALRARLAVGKSVELVSNDISVQYDPDVVETAATLATIGSSTVFFPEYPRLGAIEIEGLTIRRDGFSIDSFSTAVPEIVADGFASVAESATAAASAKSVASANEIKRPILLVPGIVGTLAKDLREEANYKNWLLHRGIHPSKIEADPLTRVYDDLIQTLVNVGYEVGKNLFVVTYDWRVLPGPEDGVIDGQIDGLTAQSLVDDKFTYGADYLGYFLDLAARQWDATHETELDTVDIIAHSTGGLVTRAYLQSEAYGGAYTVDGVPRNLPKINDFYSIGVPHRGASKAWNPLHNNVATDTSFRAVVSKIIYSAFKKLQSGEVILGPSGEPDGADAITLPKLQASLAELNEGLDRDVDLETHFIRTYVPTTQALLATFEFLTDSNGETINVNTDARHAHVRNSLALDLNAGLDLNLGGDANKFVDDLKGKFVVIAGTSEETLRFAKEMVGKDLEFKQSGDRLITVDPNPSSIVGLSGFLSRKPEPGELWYQDSTELGGGDGTVPIVSSLGQFMTDTTRIAKGKIVLVPLSDDTPGEGAPEHLPLMHLPRSQATVLAGLGHAFEPSDISQGIVVSNAELGLTAYGLISGQVLTTFLNPDFEQLRNIVSVIVDPVGAVLVDGNRTPIVGYDAANDQVIQSEGTFYLGGADGLGIVYGDFEGPFSIELTGVEGDGNYLAQADLLGGRVGGVESAGTLAVGETLTEDVESSDIFLRRGIEDWLELEGLVISGNAINVTLSEQGVTTSGTITVQADQAAFLPDVTTEALDGFVTVTGFSGSIDLQTGALGLSADNAVLQVEDVVTASATGDQNTPAISLTLDPSGNDPSSTVATIHQPRVEFATLELPPEQQSDPSLLELSSVTLRRDGFDIVAQIGGDGLSGALGQSPEILTFDELIIDVDLGVSANIDPESIVPGFSAFGSIGIRASAASLLPDSSVSVEVVDDNPGDDIAGVVGTLELETAAWSIALRQIDASLADVIDFDIVPDGSGPAAEIVLDPNAAPGASLVSFGQIDATIPALEFGGKTPAVSVTGLTFNNDASVQLDDVSVSLPDGYAGNVPVANLLPFEIQSLDVEFPDPNDLDSLRLGVTGDFVLDELQSGLRSQLGPEVTPTVTVGDGASGSLAFDLAIDSLAAGAITPINFGPITLGLSGLEVSGLTLDGSLTFGGLIDGVLQPDVSGTFAFVTTDPQDPFSGLAINVQPGSLLSTTDDGIVLNVLAEVTFDESFTGQIGGIDVAGSNVNLRFLLETSVTASAPFLQIDQASIEFISLAIDEIDITIDGFVHVYSTELSVFNPGHADGQIADVSNVTVDFIGAFDNLGTGSIDGLRLFENRIEFDNAILSVPGTIGDGTAFSFTGLNLFTKDLIYDLEVGLIQAGTIGLEAIELTLLDEATVTHPVLEVDQAAVASQSFAFSADGLTADFDDLVELSTGPLQVAVSETSNVLAAITTASVALPRIKDDADRPLTFDVVGTESEPGLRIRKDGFDIASLSVSGFDFVVDGIVDMRSVTTTLNDISYNVSGNNGGFDPNASIDITAANVFLLPAISEWSATINNFALSYAFDGSELTARGDLDLALGGSLTEDPLVDIDSTGVTLDLGESNDILVLQSATVELPRLTDDNDQPIRFTLAGSQANPGLRIRRDGFDIGNLTAPTFDFEIDGLIDLKDLEISATDISYTTGTGFLPSAEIGFRAPNPRLFADVADLDVALTGFDLQIRFDGQGIVSKADSLELTYGETETSPALLELTTGPLSLDTSADELFSVENATITLPRIETESGQAMTLDLSGSTSGTKALVVRRDGFDIGSATHTPFNFEIDGLVSMTGVEVALNSVSFTKGSGFSENSELAITAATVDLIAGGSLLSGPITGFDLTVGLRSLAISASADSVDLSYGAVDFDEVTLDGGVSPQGDLSIGLDGDMVFRDIEVGSGAQAGPLKIGFIAAIDPSEFTIGGSIDLRNEEVGIGPASNPLLSLTGFSADVGLTVPLDQSEVSGGLTVRADSGFLSPGLGIQAAVDGTQTNPGLAGSLDFATGKIDIGLQNFRADFAGILTVSAASDGAQPAVAFSFDPAANPSDPVLTFASVSAKLPAVSESITGTLTDFGFRHDGSIFLGGIAFSGIGDALEDLGIPDFISIRELGLESISGTPLTSEEIVSLQFRLTASAGIDLNEFGVPLVADVEDFSIAADALDGGNLLSSIQFSSVSVDIAPPIDVGPLSVGGGFKLESFDPNEASTPADQRQPNSILVRVSADVSFAGIDLAGDFLITEYGPIAMGLEFASEAGLAPLGPVTMFSAGAFVAFNEPIPDLPEQCSVNGSNQEVCFPDPIALIKPTDPDSNAFDLTRFDKDKTALIADAEENARRFIRENRARETPISILETPVLIALSGEFGPTGSTRSSAPILVDATIGANFALTEGDEELLLFGLGTATIGGESVSPDESLGLGTIGAVLSLGADSTPEFQLAFVSPSPGSDLADRIPATVELAASFDQLEDGTVRLLVSGDVNVLDALEAEADGIFLLDATGIYGDLTVQAQVDTDSPTIDFASFGVSELELEAEFNLLFNFTRQEQTFDKPATVDGQLEVQTITVAASTTRIFAAGILKAGEFEVEGAFLLKNDPSELIVSASGSIELGDFGNVAAEGGVRVAKDNGNQQPGAAGHFAITTQLAIPGILAVDGGAAFQFNTLPTPQRIEIPRRSGTSEFIDLARGDFFRVLIAGSDLNDPDSTAILSVFPADGEESFGADRVIGLDAEGRFELLLQTSPVTGEQSFELDFEARLDLIAFDTAVLGASASANLFISRNLVYGEFSGAVLAGDTELLTLEAELDRFGCIHTNLVFPLDHIGAPEACQPRVFIANQSIREGRDDQDVEIRLTRAVNESVIVNLDDQPLEIDGDDSSSALSPRDYILQASSRTVTIPAGSTVAFANVDTTNNDDFENRAFKLVATSARRGPGRSEMEIANIENEITIRNNDILEVGPPVELRIVPVPNAVTQIDESDGRFSFLAEAVGLQSLDTVRLRAEVFRLNPASGDLNDDFGGRDVDALVSRYDQLIRGSRPKFLEFPVLDDNIPELDEEFLVRLSIVEAAQFAPSTSLETEEFRIRIANDDPERDPNALVFYDFNGDSTTVIDGTPPQVVGQDFDFTDEASFAASTSTASILASPLQHIGDRVNESGGLPTLDALLPDDETPAAGSVGWTTRTDAIELIRNGDGSEGMDFWSVSSGSWTAFGNQFGDPGRAGSGFAATSSIGLPTGDKLSRLVQSVSLFRFSNRIGSGNDVFQAKATIETSAATRGYLEVEFADVLGRSIGFFRSDEIAGLSSGEVIVSDRIPVGELAGGAFRATVSLVALTPSGERVGATQFSDVQFDLIQPAYYDFGLRLNDVSAGEPSTPEDFDQLSGIQLSAVDFWTLADTGGPTSWELRSSADGFESVLASGIVINDEGSLRHQARVPIESQPVIRPTIEPVEFRLYGIGATDSEATWKIDNLQLIGSVSRLSALPVPPVAVDDAFVIPSQQADGGVLLNVRANDFDPNGDSIRYVGVGGAESGTLTIEAFGTRIRYQRTDPTATEDQFTYTIQQADGTLDTSTATVNVKFAEAPTSRDDRYLAEVGQTLTVTAPEGVLRNDSLGGFPNARLELLSPPSATRVDDFQFNADDGSFTIRSKPDVSAGTQVQFFYQLVADNPLPEGNPIISPFAGRVTVRFDNADIRRAIDDEVSGNEDARIEANVLANDSRGFGDPLVPFLIAPPRSGPGSDFSLKQDGVFSYLPPRNFSGDTSFVYAIVDKEPGEFDQATVTINVKPVNDRPTAHSRSITISGGQTQTVLIDVSGSDVETDAKELDAFFVGQPQLGKVTKVAARSFHYTPPAGGLAGRSDSFLFYVRDQGQGDSQAQNSALKRVTILSTKGSSAKSTSGKGRNAHLEGSTVWLELNGSSQLDQATIGGATLMEPSTQTSADGSFLLEIPAAVDANVNGVLDSDEGRLFLDGGNVVATDLPVRFPLKAHADATVVSPLTTLLVTLTDEIGLAREQAVAVMADRLELPVFNVIDDDTLQSTLDGDSRFAVHYLRGIQVINTVSMLTGYFAPATAEPTSVVADFGFRAIAERMSSIDADRVDLSDIAITRQLVETLGAFVSAQVDSEIVDGVAAMIAASNQRLAELPPVTGEEYVRQIAKVERVAAGDAYEALQQLADHQIGIATLIDQFTGDALNSRIANATTKNVRIPALSVEDVTGAADHLPAELVFTIELDTASLSAVTVRYQTFDQTLVADAGNYTPVSGMLEFAAGEVSKTVAVPYSSSSGSLGLLLQDAGGATIFDAIAEGIVLPPGGDADAVDNTVELAGPLNGDANHDGVLDMLQDNVATFVDSIGFSYITAIAVDGVFTTASTARLSASDVTELPNESITPFGSIDLTLLTPRPSAEIDLLFDRPFAANAVYASFSDAQGLSPVNEFDGVQLIDADNDGLVEAARVLPSMGSGVSVGIDTEFSLRLIPAIVSESEPTIASIDGTDSSDFIRLVWNDHLEQVIAKVNGVVVETLPAVNLDLIEVKALGGSDRILVDRGIPVSLRIDGGSGNDVIFGSDGDDQIFGGPGRDKIFGRDGRDLIEGAEGSDLIFSGRGDDLIFTGGGRNVVFAGSGNDRIMGGPDRDLFFGESGNDLIDGKEGRDRLFGGDDHDVILGGEGNDFIDGGDGDDQVHGDGGDDTINGDRGRDRLHGGDGEDRISGGSGNDTLFGDDGNDQLFGRGGDDTIRGGEGDDFIKAGSGNDELFGEDGNDRLYGNSGDDTLVGGPGQDQLHGGSGQSLIIDQDVHENSGKKSETGNSAATPNLLARDVNRDGRITAVDALQVINYLATQRNHHVHGEQISALKGDELYDANGDNQVTALDSLVIINRLNLEKNLPATDVLGRVEASADEIAVTELTSSRDQLADVADDLAIVLSKEDDDDNEAIDQLLGQLDAFAVSE